MGHGNLWKDTWLPNDCVLQYLYPYACARIFQNSLICLVCRHMIDVNLSKLVCFCASELYPFRPALNSWAISTGTRHIEEDPPFLVPHQFLCLRIGPSGEAMGFFRNRLFIFLPCVVLLLASKTEAFDVRRIQHALGWKEEEGPAEKSRRFLSGVDVFSLGVHKKPAAGTSKYGSNRMSKRRVRRGSDPIHNRC